MGNALFHLIESYHLHVKISIANRKRPGCFYHQNKHECIFEDINCYIAKHERKITDY